MHNNNTNRVPEGVLVDGGPLQRYLDLETSLDVTSLIQVDEDVFDDDLPTHQSVSYKWCVRDYSLSRNYWRHIPNHNVKPKVCK